MLTATRPIRRASKQNAQDVRGTRDIFEHAVAGTRLNANSKTGCDQSRRRTRSAWPAEMPPRNSQVKKHLHTAAECNKEKIPWLYHGSQAHRNSRVPEIGEKNEAYVIIKKCCNAEHTERQHAASDMTSGPDVNPRRGWRFEERQINWLSPYAAIFRKSLPSPEGTDKGGE